MSKQGGAGVGPLTEEEQPSSMPIERSYKMSEYNFINSLKRE
jgi:hypothetical protein